MPTPCSGCAFHLFADRLTPLFGGIRDGDHPRVAPPPPCPGSAAARSVARARPSPTTSVSGFRCSSRRTPTGSPSDEAFSSDRSNHALGIGVLPGRAWRNDHLSDVQRLGLTRKSFSIDL